MIAVSAILRILRRMDIAADGFNRERWLKTAAAIEAELDELTTGLTEAQFHAPPRDGGWCMSYCVEHLILVGRAFLTAWDVAVEQAANRQPVNSEARYGWWRRMLLQLNQNPSWLKQKADPRFVPCVRHSIGETVRQFRAMHEEFSHRVDRSRGVDVRATSVRSPFRPWIRYPLGFSFDLALAHERRHLGQARLVHQKQQGDLHK